MTIFGPLGIMFPLTLLSFMAILLPRGMIVFKLEKGVPKYETYESCVDGGDTLRVKIDGKLEYVRLIGIDTPELKDERPQVKCFALEAKMKAQMLSGTTVKLESDPTQADRDRYQRLLRYVYWNDNNFNQWMIEKGYAYEYTYGKPYKYQDKFKAAQRTAEKNNWGLWDDNACKKVGLRLLPRLSEKA